MAKKRAARAANPRRNLASRGPKENSAQSPNINSQAIQFSDSVLWAMIFCATLFAYFPALRGGLLWDDSSHLTKPGLQSLHGLWRIWFELGATQQYYPLLHSAFWLEHRMWGDAVAGYHLTNVALHALSACLVVMIMKRLSLPGAWFAGFVFALHPVNVESVAWISEQKSTLSGVFYLASLLTYLRFYQDFDQDRRKSKCLLATSLFVLALLSKTVTATLPAVLLVIFWWRRGRLEWKRDVQPLLPWFALGISAGVLTSWVETTLIGARGADFLLTPVQRVLIAGRAICFYAGKLLWPTNLMFFYPHWKIDPAERWQWLFPTGVLVLAIGLMFAARRSPLPRAVGRLSHFLRNAFPCARLSQCLSFPLLLCRRPLPVSGKPGSHRSGNGDACTSNRADFIAKGRYHRLLLHADPGSRRTDLATMPYVSRYRNPLPRIPCTQSGQLAGAL
jgi:hypothetical protein